MTDAAAPSLPARVAAALLALEAVALLALAGWQIVAMLGNDTASVATAIALVVLTLIGAVAVGAFAFAVLRDRSWGRSGGIVIQLLVLAVALGAVTGPAPSISFAVVIAVPAIAGLVVLFAAARRAGARRRTDAPEG